MASRILETVGNYLMGDGKVQSEEWYQVNIGNTMRRVIDDVIERGAMFVQVICADDVV